MTPPDVVLVAKTLCRAAATPDIRRCPFCDDKQRCDPVMWKTFVGEAQAAIAALRSAGFMRPHTTMLPGLGG